MLAQVYQKNLSRLPGADQKNELKILASRKNDPVTKHTDDQGQGPRIKKYQVGGQDRYPQEHQNMLEGLEADLDQKSEQIRSIVVEIDIDQNQEKESHRLQIIKCLLEEKAQSREMKEDREDLDQVLEITNHLEEETHPTPQKLHPSAILVTL